MQDDYELLEKLCLARLGTTLGGKWKLDRLLGIGGMAAVYAASHRNGASAAIKILHPEIAKSDEARRRFLREAYIANKAGRGAVAVLDDDVDHEGTPYLVMELLVGETVDARIDKRGGRLPLEDVLWIARETLAVLEQAHEHGIIHRDLKPENLFFTEDGRLKVLDFGIARLHDAAPGAERTRAGFVMGTPGYMAPEQALGDIEEIDARTDLWSVGAIMYKLLSGHVVHEGAANELVTAANEHALPLGRVWPDAPRPVAKIVDRALAYVRSARYPSASAMLADLAALEGAPRRRAPAVPPPPPPPAPSAASEFGLEPPSSGFATQMSESDVVALRAIFQSFEAALRLMGEHGAHHPESVKAFDVAFAAAEEALAVAHIGLFWNVRPNGFAARSQEIVWAPRPPLEKVPEHLHESGVRMLGILPGLTKRELAGLLGALVSAHASGAKSASLLEQARWEHVVQRVDMRAGRPFGKSGRRDGGAEVPAKPDAPRRGAQSMMEEAAVTTFASGLEDALTAAFDKTRPGSRERFVETTFAALRIAYARNQAHLVSAPLRVALEARAATSPREVMTFVAGLCDAAAARPDGQPGEAELASALLSPAALRSLLAALTGPANPVVGHERDVLFRCVTLAGRGQEELIRDAVVGADVEVGTRLIGVLAGMGTPSAEHTLRDLVDRAPALFRIAALASVDAPPDRVRRELSLLFESPDPSLRIRLLGVIADVRLKTAGPQLALRVRARDFDQLPIDERRQTFATLAVLVPARAETLGVQILLDQRLISSDAHERTREMAAEMLGAIASSREALDALTSVSKTRWRNSERVRAAAGRALAAIADRPPASVPSSTGKKRRPSRISQLGGKRSTLAPGKRSSKVPPPGKTRSEPPPSKRGGRTPSKRPSRRPPK